MSADVFVDIGILLLSIIGAIYLGVHIADWAIDRHWHW